MRPVNEYKISEKIASANKELFEAEPAPAAHADEGVEPVEDRPLPKEVLGADLVKQTFSSKTSSVDSDRSRRVTFRSDLEEFEPDFISDNEDDGDEMSRAQLNDESISESEDDLDSARLNNNLNTCANKNNFEEIHENSNNLPRQRHTMADGGREDDAFVKETVVSVANVDSGDGGCTEEIEEICEVIDDFGLAESAEQARVALRQKMSPIDLLEDERSSLSSASDSDNSKIINPLITKPTSQPSEHISPNSKPNRKSPTSSPSSSVKNQKQPRHSGHCHPPSSAGSNGTNRTNHSPDILKIQLNFKPCCEYKHLETTRLPRYCGYISQYGLSKEQLERREARREKHHSRRNKRNERKEQEETQKSRINEEAFENWLRLKMRSNRSGTRNMYDVAPQAKSRSIKNRKL